MYLHYSTKNYEPSEKLEAIIEKKLSKLDRFFVDEPQVAVVLRAVKKTLIMEVTVTSGNTNIRCERSGDNFYELIDECLDVLEKRIVKNKEKLHKRVKFTPDLPHDIAEEASGEIVKVKSFAIKPMDVAEAILQMELLGHDFYMFENTASQNMNTVYKRKDGNYGLIEPQE